MDYTSISNVTISDLIMLVPCVFTTVLSALTLYQTHSLTKWARGNDLMDKRIDSFMEANIALNNALPSRKRLEHYIDNLQRYNTNTSKNDHKVFKENNGEVKCIELEGCFVSKPDLMETERIANENIVILGNHVSRFRYLYSSDFAHEIESIIMSWNEDPTSMKLPTIKISDNAHNQVNKGKVSLLYHLDIEHLIRPIQIRYKLVRYYESELRKMLSGDVKGKSR